MCQDNLAVYKRTVPLEKAASKVNRDAVLKTIKLHLIIYLLIASAFHQLLF